MAKEVLGEEKKGTKVYHITKRSSDLMWQVKLGKGERALKLFHTQKEAIAYAKEVSKNQEASIRIHGVSGKIRKE